MLLAVGGAFRGTHRQIETTPLAASAANEQHGIQIELKRFRDSPKFGVLHLPLTRQYRVVIVKPWGPRNAPATAKFICPLRGPGPRPRRLTLSPSIMQNYTYATRPIPQDQPTHSATNSRTRILR